MGKRPSKFYPYKGRQCSCAELADMAGVEYKIMYYRLHYAGMSAEQAMKLGANIGIERPMAHKHTLNGVRMSMDKIADALNYTKATFWIRARQHGTDVQTEIDKEYMRQRGSEHGAKKEADGIRARGAAADGDCD